MAKLRFRHHNNSPNKTTFECVKSPKSCITAGVGEVVLGEAAVKAARLKPAISSNACRATCMNWTDRDTPATCPGPPEHFINERSSWTRCMVTLTEKVRNFYRRNPYPSYGMALKTKQVPAYRRHCNRPGRFLEAGCGTGHALVGTAKNLPHLEYYAVDLSEESLEIAHQLSVDNGVKIVFRQHDLMQPLPFSEQFDFISCLGVLHHFEEPAVGLRNLAQGMAENGILFLHLYGEDYHRRRLQIKEMLSLVAGEDQSLQHRYEMFAAYATHHRKLERGSFLRRLYRLSLRDIVHEMRRAMPGGQRGIFVSDTTLHDWRSELEEPTCTARWADQFAHPCERTFNLNQLLDLLASADLEPVEMLALGCDRAEHLPPEWEEAYDGLSPRKRFRLMELLNPTPTSPFVAARRRF